MQTPNGRMRMYQPAQNPATGHPTKMSPRNQRKDQTGLPPPEPIPPPAAILSAVRKLESIKCLFFLPSSLYPCFQEQKLHKTRIKSL